MHQKHSFNEISLYLYIVYACQFVIILEPSPPINLQVAETLEDISYINVYFDWEPPLGKGPQFIVESYQFTTVSNSSDYTTDVTSSTSNVTLEYNEEFTVSVVSVNCAGQSEPITLTKVIFGN